MACPKSRCDLVFRPAMELGTWAFTQKDFDSARYWLGRAADTGAVTAMLNLGSVLLITGDREGARKWWQRAARQGNESEKERAKLVLRQTSRPKFCS